MITVISQSNLVYNRINVDKRKAPSFRFKLIRSIQSFFLFKANNHRHQQQRDEARRKAVVIKIEAAV